MSNGSCQKCPFANNCHWSEHVNDAYRFETRFETVKKEYDDIKKRFKEAVKGQSKVEAVIKQVEEDFNNINRIVLTFVAEMQRDLKKLSEIALKKDPLQQVDYLNLLMESEKSQAKPGWQDRVNVCRKQGIMRSKSIVLESLVSIRGKTIERTRRLVSSVRSKLKRLKNLTRIKHGTQQRKTYVKQRKHYLAKKRNELEQLK